MQSITFTDGAIPVLELRVAEAPHTLYKAPEPPTKLAESRSIYEAFKWMAACPREEFWAIYLNGKNVALAAHRISLGILTASLVHPRECFSPALSIPGVAGMILVHNHPSNDCEPSPEDLEVTNRLVAVGELLGIRILDHVIVGKTNYVSFLERGLIRG